MSVLLTIEACIRIAFTIALCFMLLKLMLQKRHTLEAQEALANELRYAVEKEQY